MNVCLHQRLADYAWESRVSAKIIFLCRCFTLNNVNIVEDRDKSAGILTTKKREKQSPSRTETEREGTSDKRQRQVRTLLDSPRDPDPRGWDIR